MKRFLRKIINKYLVDKGAYTIPVTDMIRNNIAYLARIGTGVLGAESVKFHGLNQINRDVRFIGDIDLGYATTINERCWIQGPVIIGNYCQLGPNVCLQATDHDYRYLTPYNNRVLFNGELKEHSIVKPIRIDHGVWLGYGALVLKGIRIGNGAVIGANAVVTRDVAPYQIAVGNPARVIGFRFDQATINLLEETQWWLKSTNELEPYREAFKINLIDNSEQGLKMISHVFFNHM